jgi:hypothetical protein
MKDAGPLPESGSRSAESEIQAVVLRLLELLAAQVVAEVLRQEEDTDSPFL